MLEKNPFGRPESPQAVRSWEGYLYFVWEREAVRVARANGLPREMWTQDPILQKYKFTNIRRRDDRLSKWIIEHLITPAVEDGDGYLWFTLVIARLINWPPTLQALLDAGVIPCSPRGFKPAEFERVIEALPGKRYGGAYLVYPTMKDPGGVKSRALAQYIIGDVVARSAEIHEAVWRDAFKFNVQRITNTLSECFGLSTFMAGQVAADLTYVGEHFDDDLYSWAPRGPGSQRGLNYILGKQLTYAWGEEEFCAALLEAGGRVKAELGINNLTLHDQQNTMCEYSKYARTALGQGVPKSLYKPETAY